MFNRALFKSTFREKVLFMEAFILLIYFKLYLYVVPLRIWSKKINQKPKEHILNEIHISELKILKKSVQRASKRIHFKNSCLIQCLTSNVMLRKRGFHADLHLGVDKNLKSELIAHAWLTIGDFEFISDNQTKAKLF